MIGRHATLIVWAALGTGVVACELVALLSRGGIPGLGTVVGRMTTSRAGRYLLVLAWMWLGWHAFAR